MEFLFSSYIGAVIMGALLKIIPDLYKKEIKTFIKKLKAYFIFYICYFNETSMIAKDILKKCKEDTTAAIITCIFYTMPRSNKHISVVYGKNIRVDSSKIHFDAITLLYNCGYFLKEKIDEKDSKILESYYLK